MAPTSLTGFANDIRCNDRAPTSAALKLIGLNLKEKALEFEDQHAQKLISMGNQAIAEAQKCEGEGALSASDVGYLNGFVGIIALGVEQIVQQSVNELMGQLSTFLGAEPSPEDIQRMQYLEQDFAEAMHQGFISRDTSKTKKLLELHEKVSGWNKKIGNYAGKAEKGANWTSLKTIGEYAKKAEEVSKLFGERLNKAKEVLTIAQDLATVVGVDGQGDGTTMMQGINQFAAGIQLVDKIVGSKFGKAVPVFGDLWSKWYKPMVDACVKGLSKIAKLMERKDRETEFGFWLVEGAQMKRDGNGAPLIDPLFIAKGTFPGGQAVFSYLWCLREGRDPPAMSPDVKKFFLAHSDYINSVQDSGKGKELTNDWELLSSSTWSTEGRKTNLVTWLASNWSQMWAMLYGEFGYHAPH
ncbi:MAG: hypothetical protein HC886_16280 [Leptolyngbyaceae cyanobacterium SM1_1_3]|nr:hypothetical protein [Leptolyngbyaceae cyanobacterium SM1_1_3]